jgi:hypothetical protein
MDAAEKRNPNALLILMGAKSGNGCMRNLTWNINPSRLVVAMTTAASAVASEQSSNLSMFDVGLEDAIRHSL